MMHGAVSKTASGMDSFQAELFKLRREGFKDGLAAAVCIGC